MVYIFTIFLILYKYIYMSRYESYYVKKLQIGLNLVYLSSYTNKVGDFNKIYKYENNQYTEITSDQIIDGNIYWILCNEVTTIYSSYNSNNLINLSSGWNLISINNYATIEDKTFFQYKDNKYQIVVSNNLEPGVGYWIHSNTDTNITFTINENIDDICIDPNNIDSEAVCTEEYDPVIGCDGIIYSNSCHASIAGVTSWDKYYDHIVIGGGPAGIMAAYKLSESGNSVLLIEKGDGLENYGTFRNSFMWQQVSGFGYSMESIESKNLSLGEGVGGGTLHFGLQYIDNIIGGSDNMYKKWRGDSGGINYFDEINNLLDPYQYNYDSDSLGIPYNELKDEINNDSQVIWYNNKIYSEKPTELELEPGIFNAKRIVVGDILDSRSITIKTNVEINYLNLNNNSIDFCSDTNNDKYYGNNIVLCLGAIQTPILLLKSGIGPGKSIDLPVGQTLYDHAGLVSIYYKYNTSNSNSSVMYIDSEINEIKNLVGNDKFKIFDINDTEGYEDLSNVEYNKSSSPKAMHAIFQHTRLSNSQIQDAVNGNYPGSGITLGVGIKYVYNMGSYWNGSGHTGNSQFSKLAGRDYDLTTVLNLRHGDYKRLYPEEYMKDASNNCKLVGIYKESLGIGQIDYTSPIEDLGFKSTEILQHIQTRDPDLKWQTYYSIIPGAKNMLILTNSHSKYINNKGNISLEGDSVIINLNHFEGDSTGESSQDLYNHIKDAMKKNNTILNNLGYTLVDPQLNMTNDSDILNTIQSRYMSIYHYHGSCPEGEVVDSNYKVFGLDNLYIGDISVLNKPWGGSTSVPALITGYKCGENINSTNQRNTKYGNSKSILMIYNDKYELQVDQLKEFRENKGFNVIKYCPELINNFTTTDFKNKGCNELNEDYNNIKKYADSLACDYIILFGNMEEIPGEMNIAEDSYSGTNTIYNKAACDISYGMKNNDMVSIVGRLSPGDTLYGKSSKLIDSEKIQNIQNQIDKIFEYEDYYDNQKSDNIDEWIKQITGVASSDGTYDGIDIDNDGIGDADNKFMHSELGKLHNSLDIKYSELFDGHIKTDDDNINNYDKSGNTNKYSLIDEINNGTSLILYVGHASEIRLSTTSFSTSNMNDLNNDKYFLFCTVGCSVGSHDEKYMSLAESFQVAANKGSIAFFGSTIMQSWQPPMHMQSALNDSIIASNENTTIGELFKNAMLVKDNNGELEFMKGGDFYFYTLFGDPTTRFILNKVTKK